MYFKLFLRQLNYLNLYYVYKYLTGFQLYFYVKINIILKYLKQVEEIIIPAAQRPDRKRKFFDPLSAQFQTNFTSSEEASEEALRTFGGSEFAKEEEIKDIFIFKPLEQPNLFVQRANSELKQRQPTSPTPRTVVIKNVFSTPNSLFEEVPNDFEHSVFGNRLNVPDRLITSPAPQVPRTPEPTHQNQLLVHNNNLIRTKLKELKSRVTDTKESLAAADFRATNVARLRGRQRVEATVGTTPFPTTTIPTIAPFTFQRIRNDGLVNDDDIQSQFPAQIDNIPEVARNQNGRQPTNPPVVIQKIRQGTTNQIQNGVKNIELLSHDKLIESFDSLGEHGEKLKEQLAANNDEIQNIVPEVKIRQRKPLFQEIEQARKQQEVLTTTNEIPAIKIRQRIPVFKQAIATTEQTNVDEAGVDYSDDDPITQSTLDVQLKRVRDLANRFKALRNNKNVQV